MMAPTRTGRKAEWQIRRTEMWQDALLELPPAAAVAALSGRSVEGLGSIGATVEVVPWLGGAVALRLALLDPSGRRVGDLTVTPGSRRWSTLTVHLAPTAAVVPGATARAARRAGAWTAAITAACRPAAAPPRPTPLPAGAARAS